MNTIINLIEKTYYFLWGDWIHLPLPGGTTINLPLLVLLLRPDRYLLYYPDAVPADPNASGYAARAAGKGRNRTQRWLSLRTPGTDRVNCDPRWYGKSCRYRCRSLRRRRRCVVLDVGNRAARFGNRFHRGDLSPASQTAGSALRRLPRRSCYYIHDWINSKRQKQGTPVSKKNLLSVLFAFSGLICWCGISQVISNSVTSSFKNAFGIPPIYSCLFLVFLAAVIVLRKNASVRFWICWFRSWQAFTLS